MRKSRTLIAIAITAALALAGCSGNAESNNSTPPPNPASASIAAPALAPAPQAKPNRLHWVDWYDRTDPIVLDKLDKLRRAVEEIGYGLGVNGYEPLSENVDDAWNPTVLVTQWLNLTTGTVAEVHSSYGITAFTFRHGNPESDGKIYVHKWYRCPAASGITGDYRAELAGLTAKSAAELERSLCTQVVWGR